MSNRTLALVAALLFVLSEISCNGFSGVSSAVGGAAPAQSRPGLAFDQVIHATTGGDSSISVVHLTAAGSDIRMEFEKGSAAGPFAHLPLGDHGIMILRGGGTEMIILNPDKKEYFSIKPIEMIEGARKMMASMGGSVTFDSSASSLHQDSLGPGPVIDGHPTLKYRTITRMKVTASMMGQQHTIDQQSTSEIDAASDLSELKDLEAMTSPLTRILESMGVGKDFRDKAIPVEHRMHGFPLHVVQQSTQTSNGVARTTTQTTDTKNIRRVTVPDSAFAIPADYKIISGPGMPPGGVN